MAPLSVGRATVRGHRVREAATMTTLENRPNTALLVVDVQRGVVE